VLLLLIGVSVLVSKGSAGWVEIILGLGLIIAPLFMTAQKRRVIHAAEEKRRAERAEQEARDREMLAEYAAALDRLREKPDSASLDVLRREREKLDLPYAIWGDAARSTILQVGFNELARLGAEKSPEIAALMDRGSAAAGLIAADVTGVKHSLYATVLWHLLADDRLGTAQRAVVRTIQKGFGIEPEAVPVETSSEAEFDRLRGVDHRNVPLCDSTLPLAPREFCIETSSAEAPDGKAALTIIVTNKRIVVDSPKREEVAIADVDEIEVDAENGTVAITSSRRKRPLTVKVPEPIYFASLLSLATTLDERPKSFM
jgi:hypothetical protein